jgi:hypothetical protein
MIMTIRNTSQLIACLLLLVAPAAYAQELEDFPDSALTGEQWQQRLLEARRRSEQFVANARNQAVDPPPSDKEEAEVADQRVMNDPSLQRGDIIATSKGLFVFVGRDSEAHQPGDFFPVPNWQRQP